MNRLSLILLLTTFGITSSYGVHAAFLPAPYVVKTMAKKRPLPKSLRVTTQVSVTDNEGKSVAKWKQTWTEQNGLLRVRALDANGKVLYASEWSSASKLPVWLSLLWPRDVNGVMQDLKNGGLAVDQATLPTELRRFGPDQTSIAWVYGKSPELWIEKDAFFAVRWVVQGAGTQKLEWQFLDYRGQKEVLFPRKWIFRQTDPSSQMTNSDHWQVEEEVIEITAAPTPADNKNFAVQSPSVDAEMARKVYQLY